MTNEAHKTQNARKRRGNGLQKAPLNRFVLSRGYFYTYSIILSVLDSIQHAGNNFKCRFLCQSFSVWCIYIKACFPGTVPLPL